MNPARSWWAMLFSKDRRKAERHKTSRLAAYYWNGDTPVPHSIRDTSSSGLYIITDERWYPNTVVTMTLQRTVLDDPSLPATISVPAKVVRSGPDGVGLRFVLPRNPGSRTGYSSSANSVNQKSLNLFLKPLQEESGQALIEYLLVLPMLLLLVVNLVNFGGFLFAWITVANAARAGADYAIMGGASVGSPQAASASQISSLITQDVSSLPNVSSLAINVCQNYNGTITTLAGTCTSIPSDPEPSTYVLTTVDVTYTYNPFISSGFQFPSLNVYATLPPTTVHRRAVMRQIQ